MYLKGKRSSILYRMAAVFLTAALFAAMTLGIPADLEAAENGSSESDSTQAQNGSTSETAVYTVGNTTYTYSIRRNKTQVDIIDCSTTDTEIDIPGEINGLKVTGIGWIEAFKGCSGLVSVTIPEGVTSIGERTFEGCSSLASVTIPSSVTSIGFEAFKGCSSLVSVTIPESITTIKGSVFYGCSGLTSVTIPSSVTRIEGFAFYGCSGLKSVVIPEGVTSIGIGAFNYCRGLTSVTIPSSVTSIENGAFAQCQGITSITIPSSVTSMEAPCWNCRNLTEIKVAADNLNYKDIDGVLFNKAGTELIQYPSGRKGMYTIPESVESIGDSAFTGCHSLTSITIPEGATNIGERAFDLCSGLTTVTIPSSVTSIGKAAFNFGANLTEIKVAANNKNYKDIDGVLFNKVGTELIQCPCMRVGSYIIPQGVTSIEYSAFGNCRYLTSVTIPSSVTNIESEAFYWCGGLTSVEIPEGVISVGNFAFNGCVSLTSVTVPSSVKEIGGYAFGYDRYTKINNVTIYGHRGTAAESYADKNGFTFVEAAFKSDSSTNIAIQYPKDAIENDELITLITKGIAENGDEYEQIKGKLNAENAGNVKFAAFDIKLQDNNGNSVQPRGQITVKIPVPAGLNGSRCRVYYMDGNGKFTDMNATYSNGFVVFSTNHFSMYIVTEAQIISSGDGSGSGDATDDSGDNGGDASDDNGDNEDSGVSGGSTDGSTPIDGNNTSSDGSGTNIAETPDNGSIEAPSEAANGENRETPSEAGSGNGEAEETSDDSASPKTGDTSGRSTALLMMCIVSAGAAVLAVRRKKA